MICRLCKHSFEKHNSPYYFLCQPCLKKERERVRGQNKRKNKTSILRFATWMNCLLIHQFRCRFCDGNADKLDHIVSFYNGGNNKLENIQPLCKACDKRKTKIEVLLQSAKSNRFKHGINLLDTSYEYFVKIDFAA